MDNFSNTMAFSGLAGFLTGFLGIMVGILSSSFMKSRGMRFKGTVLGMLGGFSLGILCFDILPEAFRSGSIFLTITGSSIGLILAVILDGKLDHRASLITDKCSFRKAAIFMSIGIAMHNLPSGIALGSLFSVSPVNGFYLSAAIMLHDIPDGLTLGIFFRECGEKIRKLVLIAFLTSLPMALGSLFGCFIKSPVIITLSLSFAAVMILYVTIRETLPLANKTWNGRLTTIGNVIGMVFGMIILYLFQTYF